MKIGIYVAHDDDSIIGVGGTIINRLKLGDEIYIVIFTDGQNSHTESFEIQANPNPQEVKEKRRKEIENAINVLGLKKDCLTFLNQIDAAGDCWKDDKDLFEKVLSITNKEKPDQIYYHYQLDNHVDHRAVSEIFSKVFRELDSPVEAYQFPVWGKIENPDIVCNIWNVLDIKKASLNEMKSQVLKNPPYECWGKQDRAVLIEEAMESFLKPEEVFRKVYL